MPSKLNAASNSKSPPVEGHASAQPVKAFQRTVAQLAKPFKGLGFGTSKRSGVTPEAAHVIQSAQVSNSVPRVVAETQLSAEDLEQVDRFFARMEASLRTDRILSDPIMVETLKLKAQLTELRKGAKKIENDIDALRVQLRLTLPSDKLGVIKIKLEIMKKQDLVKKDQDSSRKLCDDLHKLLDSQCTKLQKRIDLCRQQIGTADYSGQQRLLSEIDADQTELLKIDFDRVTWQV